MGPDPEPIGRERLAVCALLAVPVVVLSVVPAVQFGHWAWVCLTAAAPVVVWGGLPLHRGAARALRRGALGDDVPALLGTAGAAAWSVAVLLRTGAGDPGWTQPFPPAAAPPPVRLDVAAGITLALLVAARLRAPVGRRPAGRAVVPVVLAVAAGVLGYRLGAGDDAVRASTVALAVLLVAAPSAFRPCGARAERVERRVDTVLFTSRTLTGGPRRLDDVRTAEGTGHDEALRMAGSLAEASTHPVALAIATAAAERGEVPAVGEFDERPGLGASGIVAELHPGGGAAPDLAAVTGPTGRRADGTAVTVVAHAVLLGHPDLLTVHGVELPPDLRTARDEIEEAGHTAVAVAWDGRARAVLAVATDVGADAHAAVGAVRRVGAVPALLSARPSAAATAVAVRAGVDAGRDTVLAGVRPDAEAEAVARLRADGRVVAVVGRRGRDDDALGAADVALAVADADGSPGHAGASAAVAALRRRRRRPGPAQWTVAAYHLAALPVAASGMIDPLLAGLAGALVAAALTGRPVRWTDRVSGVRRRPTRPGRFTRRRAVPQTS